MLRISAIIEGEDTYDNEFEIQLTFKMFEAIFKKVILPNEVYALHLGECSILF